MLVETTLGEVPLREMAAQAAAIERIGFDGIAQAELRHDPFLPLALAAPATRRARLATSVAIAFPRSPTAVAYTARDLQDLSEGRFVLGLGTQVKPHIERRFATVWESPGPKLRDYIQAMRAVWDTWQHGAPLNYQGEFYKLSLMTPEFSPAPSAYPQPPVQIAAVNPYNIRLAGEICDGLRVHPFSTPSYTREVIWPNVRKGAARAGRSLAGFEMVGGGFIATGPDEAAVRKAREDARYRIAFYASTPSYLPVLEHHGWEALGGELRALTRQGRWDDMAALIPDEMLDAFCVAGTYDTIGERARAVYAGLVDALSFPLPRDLDAPDDRYLRALAGIKAIPPSSEDLKTGTV